MQHVSTENHGTGVYIHLATTVHSTGSGERLLALLVQEGSHGSVLSPEENTVIFPGAHIFLEADSSGPVAGVINQQRVEQQQHISA